MKERQINTMMSSRASSLLRKASGGFEPSAADKIKTRAAIARRIAVGVAAGAAVSAGAKSAAAAPSLAPAALAPAALPALGVAPTAAAPVAAGFAGLGFATKLVAAVAIVGTISAGAVTVHRAATNKAPAPTMANALVGPKLQQSASPENSLQYIAVRPPAVAPTAVPRAAVTPAELAAPVEPLPIANPPQNKPVQKIESVRANVSPKAKTAAPALQTGAEVELFQRAQLALRADDDTTALALLDEHARRFPNGQLAEDRDAARVLALCGAGRREDAATAGAAFLRAHPESPLAARVRSSCANIGTTGSSE